MSIWLVHRQNCLHAHKKVDKRFWTRRGLGHLVGDVISRLPEVAGLRVHAQSAPLAQQIVVFPGQGTPCIYQSLE